MAREYEAWLECGHKLMIRGWEPIANLNHLPCPSKDHSNELVIEVALVKE
jgi:hypothetical protein